VDNPYLNKDYVATLQTYPEPLRSQLLYGKWNALDMDDPNQVIKRSWVDAAMKRWTEENPFPKRPLSMGVDPAHGGRDLTVVAKCYGSWFDRLITRLGVETPDGKSVATLVIANRGDSGNIMVDLVGYGAAAHEILRDAGLPVFGCNGGETSTATDHGGNISFANKRTEIYWKLREALDPTYGMDLRLPPDDELKSDLCAIKWEFVKDRIRVEPKELTKERIGRSPDRGDAVAYAWSMNSWDTMTGPAVTQNHEYTIYDE
jgi:hypothetical protein